MNRNAMGFEDRLQRRISVKGAKKKVRALILHVSQEMADDPYFGMTKLNKVLWRIDFYAFQARGKPVTGMLYQKLENGPALRMMLPTIHEMEAEGLVARRDEKMTEHHVRKLVIPRQGADMSLFDDEEKSIIAYAIKVERGKTAAESSRDSHGPAWEMSELKKDIPYELALISDRQPSALAVRRAKVLAGHK